MKTSYRVLTPLDSRAMKKPEYFKLLDSMLYYHDLTQFFVVEKGFETNFASIPKPFRTLYSVNGSHREEATAHDDHYDRNGIITSFILPENLKAEVLSFAGQEKPFEFFEKYLRLAAKRKIVLSRKECDQVFYDGLLNENRTSKSWTFKKMLNWFGGIQYRLTKGRWW